MAAALRLVTRVSVQESEARRRFRSSGLSSRQPCSIWSHGRSTWFPVRI